MVATGVPRNVRAVSPLCYVKTDGNISDVLTKCLPKAKFVKLRDFLRGDVLPIPEDKSQWSRTLRDIHEQEEAS